MPVKGSTAKRHRQSESARLRNRMARSTIRTAVRKFLEAVEAKDREKALAEYKNTSRLLDTAAGKGVYHRNTAARKKSRMHKLLNTLNVE